MKKKLRPVFAQSAEGGLRDLDNRGTSKNLIHLKAHKTKGKFRPSEKFRLAKVKYQYEQLKTQFPQGVKSSVDDVVL